MLMDVRGNIIMTQMYVPSFKFWRLFLTNKSVFTKIKDARFLFSFLIHFFLLHCDTVAQ